MVAPFAEVIGDPIAQSKSPIIHRHWLQQLGMEGDYVATRVTADELAGFIERRRTDPLWRGCSVTIPHKQAIMPLLDEIDPGARAIGAANCVVPRAQRLLGFNTDIDGVAAALDRTLLEGRKAAVIGAGGGARAVIAYLAGRKVRQLVLLVRDPKKAQPLRELAPEGGMEILSLEQRDAAFDDAAAIINASLLGMVGAAAMSEVLLESVARHARGATLFDLVTTPSETPFLAAGRAHGGHAVDGLTMLVGQASRAFELFFGQPAPAPDQQLRDLLTT